jgi:hypothetical protein
MNPSLKPTTSSQSTTTTKSTPSSPNSPPLFLREQAFARVKAAQSKWSASDVVNEALRIRGHCAHVESPSPPIIHYGVDASKLQSLLDELELKSLSVKVPTVHGLRRQRSDTPIVMCVVVSHPKHPRNRNESDCVDWRARTISWIRRRYGDEHIGCILEHADEGYQHLHVFLHNAGASVKPMMAGEIAVTRARAANVPKSELGKAYKAGCKDLLDSYWYDVGRACGLSRQSPAPRPRVSRQRHIAERERQLDGAITAAQLAKSQADAQAVDLARRAENTYRLGQKFAPAALVNRETELSQRERDLTARARLFDDERERALARTSELTAELEGKLAAAKELLKLLTLEEREDLKLRVANRSRP